MTITEWNFPVPWVWTPSALSEARAAMAAQVLAGNTDGRQYTRYGQAGIRLWKDAVSAQAWIDFLESSEVAAYLVTATMQDYTEPTLTKKSVITWNSPGSVQYSATTVEKINEMVIAGKTDGTNYSAPITGTGMEEMLFTNDTTANEWISFISAQPEGAAINTSGVVNNDIVPVTVAFSEFNPSGFMPGQNIQDPSGSFDIPGQSFTINNGVTNGSGVAFTNLTAGHITDMASNPCKQNYIWQAFWTTGSTYEMTNVAMHYQPSNNAIVFWILDPADTTNQTAVSVGTFKLPVTLKPSRVYSNFTN